MAIQFDLTAQRFGKLLVLAREQTEKKGGTYWRCRCDCGNECVVMSKSLRNGTRTDCGCTPKERRNGRLVDLCGQRFGMLQVLEKTPGEEDGVARWRCRCDCGNQCVVRGRSLRNGQRTDCGCQKPLYHDLTGQRFGHLTVLERDYTKGWKDGSYWRCRCDCGNEVSIKSYSLRNGERTDCGCYSAQHKSHKENALIDLTGQRFGALTVLEKAASEKDKRTRWLCRCDCGNTCVVTSQALRKVNQQSCGCGKIKNLLGQRFGKLTVVARSDKYVTIAAGTKKYLWECRCDCGETAYRLSEKLRDDVNSACVKCAQKTAASLMLENAGFVGGTQTAKIRQTKPLKNSKSGIRGVFWNSRTQKWRAMLKFKGENHYLGEYKDIQAAAEARKKAEGRYFGEYLGSLGLEMDYE